MQIHRTDFSLVKREKGETRVEGVDRRYERVDRRYESRAGSKGGLEKRLSPLIHSLGVGGDYPASRGLTALPPVVVGRCLTSYQRILSRPGFGLSDD